MKHFVSKVFRRWQLPLLAPLLGVVLAMAFVLPAFASTVVKDVPFNAEVLNTCVTPEETAQLTGTLHTVYTITSNKSGGFLVHTLFEVRGTATSSTGTVYTYSSTNNSVNNVQAGQEFTQVLTASYVSRGGASNQTVSILAHQTINANGDVTVTIDNEAITCH